MIVRPTPEEDRGSYEPSSPTSLGPLFEPTQAEIASALGETYTQYWLLPEDAPIQDYRRLYDHMLALEAKLMPATIIEILERTASDFHTATGHCPFCREPGPLHLTDTTANTPVPELEE